MDKSYLIQLTQNLYQLTLLFPKKEPLRYKMREIADEILAASLGIKNNNQNNNQNENLSSSILEDLEVLDAFFEVAKKQNWVAIIDLLRVQEEYNRIKAEIKKGSKRFSEKKEAKPAKARILAIPNWRQEKILEFLRENGQAQVWQLKQIFPEVTKRTLRRDFGSLLKQNLIERKGERNKTFYQLKKD